jgi:probable phosphoglycerate mutase
MPPSPGSPSADRLRDTTFYLVRHGETDYNRDDIIQGGGIDSALNATGRLQSEALAHRLKDEPLDVVYASPMQRTMETADIVAAPHGSIARKRLDALREMMWGVFEGQGPSEERDAKLDAIKADWRRGNIERAIDGGESIQDVQIRAQDAINHLLAHEAGKTVLVVTHGRYLRVFLSTLIDDADLSHMHTFAHSNTCVNRVVYRSGFRADLLNCTAHLDNVASLE